MLGKFMNKKEEEKSGKLENKIIFQGTLISECRETQRTEGLYSFKVRGQVNDSACEIPIFVKSMLLADDINNIDRYSLVEVIGHIEYPVWTIRNGQGTKTKLIFVADRCTLLD